MDWLEDTSWVDMIFLGIMLLIAIYTMYIMNKIYHCIRFVISIFKYRFSQDSGTTELVDLKRGRICWNDFRSVNNIHLAQHFITTKNDNYFHIPKFEQSFLSILFSFDYDTTVSQNKTSILILMSFS